MTDQEPDNSSSKLFYDREYADENYATPTNAEEHLDYPSLSKFVEEYGLEDKKCLEIGCGRGAFQDLVNDYTGFDLSTSLQEFIKKEFRSGDARQLPFKDSSFDAIWTVFVLEHIPDPEKALSEMRRVLKPGGLLYLAPAWHCRSWAADGYPVRPYSDFGLGGKLVKFSIIFRNARLYLMIKYLCQRLSKMVRYRLFNRNPGPFYYKLLKANFDHFWMSDSDAVNSMDQLDAIYWFMSRGDICLNFESPWKRLTSFKGQVVIKVRERGRLSHSKDP